MGLYLAELAPPDSYKDDPAARGHLLVVYKRELRWAKPCMRYGAFEVPDAAWVRRNYTRFKVCVDFEDQRVAAATQESLIWVGFLPVGEDAYPSPPALAADYPAVAAHERGAWRTVLRSVEGEEYLEVYKLDPAAETPLLALRLDGTAKLLLHTALASLSTQEGTALLTVTDNDITAAAPDGSVFLGTGAAEPVPLGLVLTAKLETLVDHASTLIDNTLAANVMTAWGPSGPVSGAPGAAALTALKSTLAAFKSTLAEIQSEFVFVKKTPA